MRYQTILFDVDGTLCDPGPSMIDAARFAVGKLGVDSPTDDELHRLIGPPLEHAFRDVFGFDEAKVNEAVKLFRQKLSTDGLHLYTTYPGMTELIEQLHHQGKTLAVVTSKIEHIARPVLEAAGLLKYFTVLSAQQANEVVEKSVILQRALEALDVSDNTSVVMVGDRRHDVEAAKAHGVDSVGVLWGYGDRVELEHEGATYIVDSAKALGEITLAS